MSKPETEDISLMKDELIMRTADWQNMGALEFAQKRLAPFLGKYYSKANEFPGEPLIFQIELIQRKPKETE